MTKLFSKLLLLSFLLLPAQAFAQARLAQLASPTAAAEDLPADGPESIVRALTGRIIGGPSEAIRRRLEMVAPEAAGRGESFTITMKLLECVVPDKDLPAYLTEMKPEEGGLFEHTACGRLKARQLMAESRTGKVGETLSLDGQRNVSIAATTMNVKRQGAGFVYLPQTTQRVVKAGPRVDVTLLGMVDDRVGLAYHATVTDVADDKEDMLILSSGKTYLNPRTRIDERIMTVIVDLKPGDTDIISGDVAYRTVAPDVMPKILPEEGRLWIETTLKKAAVKSN